MADAYPSTSGGLWCYGACVRSFLRTRESELEVFRGVQSISVQPCLELRVGLTRGGTHGNWEWALSLVTDIERATHAVSLITPTELEVAGHSCLGRGILAGSDLTLLPLPKHVCFIERVTFSMYQLYPQLVLVIVLEHCRGYPPLYYPCTVAAFFVAPC